MSIGLIYGIAGLLVCLVEGYLFYFGWEHFLQCRMDKRWKTAAFIGTAECIIFAINRMENPAVNLTAACLIYLLVGLLLYEGNLLKRIYLTAYLWFTFTVIEFFTVFLFNMAMGSRTIYDSYGNWGFLLMAVVTKGASYFMVRLICQRCGGVIEDSNNRIFLLFLLFPAASICLFFGLAYLDIRIAGGVQSNLFLLFGSLMVFILNLLLLEVCSKIINTMNEIRQYEILSTKSEMKNQQYVRTEELRQQVHNMINHIKTIHVLAQENKNGDILSLTEQWGAAIECLTSARYCQSDIINAVLNEKQEEAAARNVDCKIFVEAGFSMGKIKEIDAIGILSNLLDNAIEAAGQRADGYVRVNMFCPNDGRLIILKAENNFVCSPTQANGQFVTGKTDKNRHGYGIRYVKEVVKKYGGWCDFSIEEMTFVATVMFQK